MEFTDIVLYLIYLALSLAMASVLWALYRRNRRGSGRESVQNGIRIRMLNLLVWIMVIVIMAVSKFAGDGSLAETMIYTILAMLVLTLLSVAWALLKRR